MSGKIFKVIGELFFGAMAIISIVFLWPYLLWLTFFEGDVRYDEVEELGRLVLGALSIVLSFVWGIGLGMYLFISFVPMGGG